MLSDRPAEGEQMRAHLSINVRSLQKSVEFYSKVFGIPPQKKSESYAKFDLKAPAFNFSMHEVVDGRIASRVNHLGIEVMSESEIGDWQKKVEGAGISTVSEEGTDCCYALQDKFWFEDPDGNSWEVFFVHEQLPVSGAEPPHQVKKTAKGGKPSACGPDSGSGCC
jgi:catechol 2,3-dioxygenase-like lactoylglutathione lyase family enzyme